MKGDEVVERGQAIPDCLLLGQAWNWHLKVLDNGAGEISLATLKIGGNNRILFSTQPACKESRIETGIRVDCKNRLVNGAVNSRDAGLTTRSAIERIEDTARIHQSRG